MVSWSESVAAERYTMRYRAWLSRVDTSGHYHSDHWEHVVSTIERMATFTADQVVLSRFDLDSIVDMSASVSVWAVVGPREPGDVANISGDGMGFFTTSTHAGMVRFSSDLAQTRARTRDWEGGVLPSGKNSKMVHGPGRALFRSTP